MVEVDVRTFIDEKRDSRVVKVDMSANEDRVAGTKFGVEVETCAGEISEVVSVATV